MDSRSRGTISRELDGEQGGGQPRRRIAVAVSDSPQFPGMTVIVSVHFTDFGLSVRAVESARFDAAATLETAWAATIAGMLVLTLLHVNFIGYVPTAFQATRDPAI